MSKTVNVRFKQEEYRQAKEMMEFLELDNITQAVRYCVRNMYIQKLEVFDLIDTSAIVKPSVKLIDTITEETLKETSVKYLELAKEISKDQEVTIEEALKSVAVALQYL